MRARPSVLRPVLAFLALAALPACGGSSGGGIGFTSTVFFDAAGFCGCSDGDVGDFPNTGADLGNLPDGAFIEILAAIQDPGDEDWFEVEVDLIGNEFLEVTLEPSNNEDYELEIYDAGLNLIQGPLGLRGDQPERLVVLNYIGDLFIRVYGFGGNSDEDEPYELRLEVVD